MSDRYSKQDDDPLRQALNSENQTAQREHYRRLIAGNPEHNTGMPGNQKSENPSQKKGQRHKSSQDTGMLEKDDRFLDYDNNIRKDADVNLDQNK